VAEPKYTNDRRSDDQGFSLIELVMALAVLGLVLAAAAPVMMGALNLSRNNRNRSIAAGLANQQIDSVRDTASTNFASLGAANSTTTQVVDGTAYTIAQYGEYVPPGGTLVTTSSCSGSATGPKFLRITVLVSWPNMAGVTPVQNQTILAPPAGSFNPYLGAIGVMVLDRNGKPQVNVQVSIDTTPATVIPTSLDGCAYFPDLTPNTPAFSTYTVTLSKVGYVDRQFDFSANALAAVTAGDAVQVLIDYDNAAQIQTTLTGASGGYVPAGVPLTLYNTKLKPAGQAFPVGSGSPRTTLGLFPDPAGFKVWAGNCADADPEGHTPPASPAGPPYYAGATRPAAVAVTPGGTSNTTLNLLSVDVTVNRVSGNPVQNATVTAVHDPDPNSCTTGDSLILGPLQLTNGSGTVRVALPYGTWHFTATAPLPVGTMTPLGNWTTVTLAPGTPLSTVATATVKTLP
jgi:prepilin-type N-terminal cleavage/methylation domain-containing protein